MSESQAVPTYFAFPDGVFHYVCAECTALCCRGQGFAGSLKREMTFLLVEYPALGSMTVSREGDIVSFATPAGRCFFLDDDNLCGIEKRHGKARKPGVCTLFPFNLFMRLGDAVAISPHLLCPLRLQVPPRPGCVEGTHETLERAVRESGLLDPSYVRSYVPALRLHPSKSARAVLERERNFTDKCGESIGRCRFSEFARAQFKDSANLDGFLRRACQILGWEAVQEFPQRDPIDETLFALAPRLRLDFLMLPSEGILRGLALGEILVRRAFSISRQLPSPQAVHHVFTSMMPTLRLLARSDEPGDVRRTARTKVPPFGNPELTFVAFKFLREAPNLGVLGALEKAMDSELTISDRSALLNQLGGQLDASSRKPKNPKRHGSGNPSVSHRVGETELPVVGHVEPSPEP